MEAFKAKLLKEWDAIPQETLHAACASFTARFKAVVKKKGRYIGFESLYLNLSNHKQQYSFRVLVFWVEDKRFVALVYGHPVYIYRVIHRSVDKYFM